MKHVVRASEAPRLFDRRDISRLFHNAHQPLIAYCICAIGARIDVGNVVADGAQLQPGLQLADRICQPLRIFRRGSQNVKGQSLSALRADPRQLAQLVNQPRHRFGESRH